LFQVADVVPAVEFSRLEEVLVLTSPPREINVAIEAAERARATPEPTATETPAPTPTPAPGAKRRTPSAPKPVTPSAPKPSTGPAPQRAPHA